jgi:hypothetical protein
MSIEQWDVILNLAENGKGGDGRERGETECGRWKGKGER